MDVEVVPHCVCNIELKVDSDMISPGGRLADSDPERAAGLRMTMEERL